MILFSKVIRPVLDPTHPPSEGVLMAFSPGIKWSWYEANHASLPVGENIMNVNITVF
jgi:hypothetical protein